MNTTNFLPNSSQNHNQPECYISNSLSDDLVRQRITEQASPSHNLDAKINKTVRKTIRIIKRNKEQPQYFDHSNKHLIDSNININLNTSNCHIHLLQNHDEQYKTVNTNFIPDDSLSAITEYEIQPTLSRGFCDRLTITFGEKDLDTEEFSIAIRDLIGKSIDGPYLSRKKMKTTSYQDNYRIWSSEGKKLAILQLRGKTTSMHFARLEFTPSKLDKNEVAEIRQALKILFGSGYQSLLDAGRITRLDATIDIKGQSIHDLIACTPRPQQNMHWMRSFAKDGTEHWELGSHYIGSIHSGRRIVIYDKARHLFETKGIAPKQAITRVEVRYFPNRSSHSALVKDVLNASNPLSALGFVYLPSSQDVEPSLEFYLLGVKQWGLNVTLSKIKDKNMRSKLRRIMAKKSVEWWNPERIWNHVLRHVRSLGLFPRNSFTI